MNPDFTFENKSIRILLADDMSLSRVMGRKLLLELGYSSIQTVENGRLAWEALEKGIANKTPFGLVLTDWMMPELNGLELLQKVKDSNWSETPPIVFMTAETDATQVAQAIKLGISGYVPKPLTLEALKRVLISLGERTKTNKQKQDKLS